MVQMEAVEKLRQAQKSELESLSEKQRRAKKLLDSQWMGPEAIEEEIEFVSQISYISRNQAEGNNPTTLSTCMAVDNCTGGYIVGVACSEKSTNSTAKYVNDIEIYEDGLFKELVRTKHEHIILDLQFKPSDNRILAIGSKDHCFSFYDRRQSDAICTKHVIPTAPVGSVCWDTNCPNIFLCAQNFGNVLLFDIRNFAKPLNENESYTVARLSKGRVQNPEFFKFVKVNCFWGMEEAECYRNEHTPTYVLSNEFGVSLFSQNKRQQTRLDLFVDCTISRKSTIADYTKEPAPGPIACTAFDINTKSLALFERVYPYYRLFAAPHEYFHNKNEQHRELNILQYPCRNRDMLQDLSADEKHLWIPQSRFSISYKREHVDPKTFDDCFITPNCSFKEIDFVRHHSLRTSSLCLTLINPSYLSVFDTSTKKSLTHLDLDHPELPPVTGVTGFYDETNNGSMVFVHRTIGFSSYLLNKKTV
jgi:WD40 repeat protein